MKRQYQSSVFVMAVGASVCPLIAAVPVYAHIINVPGYYRTIQRAIDAGQSTPSRVLSKKQRCKHG